MPHSFGVKGDTGSCLASSARPALISSHLCVCASALHTLTILHKLSSATTDFVGSDTGDKELEIRQKHGVMAFQQHSGIVGNLRSSLVDYSQ